MATELDPIAVMGVAKITSETTSKIHNAAGKARQIAADFEGKTTGGQGKTIVELILQSCTFFTKLSDQMADVDKGLVQKKTAIEQMNVNNREKYAAIEEFTQQVTAKASQDYKALAATG